MAAAGALVGVTISLLSDGGTPIAIVAGALGALIASVLFEELT
jgi:hypothetical protein